MNNPEFEDYNFSGYATRINIKCTDGRTIRKDAFKHNDGEVVPIVWNHSHNAMDNVLGKALLEHRDDGVYAYGIFNHTENGELAKELVESGDINKLSIYANHLKQSPTGDVLHGDIKELSLVLAGANSGAYIDNVIIHGEESSEEAYIYLNQDVIFHGDDDTKLVETKKEDSKEKEKVAISEKTIGDILKTMNEEQQAAVYFIVGEVLKENGIELDENGNAVKKNTKGEDEEMSHNLFENEQVNRRNVLSHSDVQEIFSLGKRAGSLKEGYQDFVDSKGVDILSHDDDLDSSNVTATYGIDNVDYLFPDAHNIYTPPEFIKREMGWVSVVMNGVKHTPFSRIKTQFADITADEARAKGYIKGKYKKEEVFTLLKRTTTPTTIYKKQKMDRDDIVDITDFDVLAWLKAEMRVMLDEEIARAILIGDGRLSSSDDKINESNIRPIYKDEDFFSIKKTINTSSSETDSEKADKFIEAIIRSRKDYKGSGNPMLFTTEDMLTSCLLLKDGNGRYIYESEDKLATALRVSKIVPVEVMENISRQDNSGSTLNLMGIVVNLQDYNVGADKGGAVNMFDDFDIDYNQQKYLIETRCSGALIKPASALVFEEKVTA